MNILLHICCGPCTIYPLEELRKEGHEVSGYFYNPNIHPYSEFTKRLDTVKDFVSLLQVPLDADTADDLESFLAGAIGRGRDRCLFCYRMRLEKAFERAREGGFDALSTTLLYSRYQRHEDIRAIGEDLGKRSGISFFYRDFRKGWNDGVRRSKELNMYRQQYCGCIFSESERYRGR